MQVWRLVAHHEQGLDALELMKKRNRIAIGWNGVGDLSQIPNETYTSISEAISLHYPDLNNAHLGGPSLWNFYHKMQPGDLVIISSLNARRCVFEILGDYFFDEDDQLSGYCHQREACLTDIPPEKLWQENGATFAKGYNKRWTLVLCGTEASPSEDSVVFQEGKRFSVTSTAIERSPAAREACLAHYGYKYECEACGFNFERAYGEHGKHYIHVHHRVELASSKGPMYTDPSKDLVPLCPNCHAMVHRGKGTMPVEELKRIIQENKVHQRIAVSETSPTAS